MINELKERDGISENVKLNRIYLQFNELLKLLKERELPLQITDTINKDIEELNSSSLVDKDLRKFFKKKQTKILNLLEKDLKIVPKDHYKTMWSALGSSVFGFPLGMAISSAFTDNRAFLAVGIAIGMVIGMVIGTSMDKKALKEGRQLNINIKY